MQPLGFEYTKSRQRMRRSRPPFVEEFSFQSSHNNVPGHFVSLSAHAAVGRPDYADWLKAHQHPYPHPGIAASELGQLGGGPWKFWNLADSATRPDVLAEIRSAMTGPGFALFNLIESEDDLVRELLSRDVPGTWFVSAAEYLVFLGRRDDAAAVIQGYLERLGKPWGTGWYADRLPEAIARWNLPVQLRMATPEEGRQMAEAARRREDAMAKEFGFTITRYGPDG